MRLPLLVVLFCITLWGAFGQTSQRYKINSNSDTVKKNYVVIDPATWSKNPGGEVRLIVKLKSSPIIRTNGRVQASNVEAEHQQFKDDLVRLTNAKARTSSAPAILHEYRTAFNGFAITATREIADELRTLTYIESVSEDKKVEAWYSENNQVIRAPETWQSHGVTGKNVVIGIIDTGIDYSHPDLGGGIGNGFKVIGGYDFVNNDSDPRDDHGHGTHVAGIAAANGSSFKGVAPDAKLVAYKVLDVNGSGWDSWILAGIERCADPDQNPATNDALDVVNMSLGRFPDPNEPLSTAVNNAVAQGIVFTIAAGNSGDYFSIGTPGIAPDAITVGATDNYKYTTYFSSKGPTEGSFDMKPEVAAPGYAINSTFLNGAYQTLNGTSMASPHVAGAVALLLEKHPDWSPQMIKSALMGSARSLSPYVWDQGAGVIDIFESVATKFVVSPGSINFGKVSASSGQLTRSAILTVTNTSGVTNSFSLSHEGEFAQTPFQLFIAPSSFSLAANESIQVEVTLTADAGAIAPQNFPEAYQGFININSGGKVVKTPLTLVNPKKTIINFTGELPTTMIVIGINGSWYWKAFQITSSTKELYLPDGKYDIILQYEYGAKLVILEEIDAFTEPNLTADKALAKNRVNPSFIDRNGTGISTDYASLGSAFVSGKERNIFIYYTGFLNELFISDQHNYRLEFSYMGKSNTGEYHDIVATTGIGITSNVTASNSQHTFAEITFTNPSVSPGSNQNAQFFWNAGFPGSMWFTSWNYYPIQVPAVFKMYQTQRTLDTHYFSTFLTLGSQPGYTWETGEIRACEGDSIQFRTTRWADKFAIQQKNFDYKLDKTIPNFTLSPMYFESKIAYWSFFGRGAFDRTFGARENGTIYYKLSKDGAVLSKGSFAQSIAEQTYLQPPTFELTPGIHTLEFEYSDFQTAGRFGIAKYTATFNNQEWDKSAPTIRSLRLLSEGVHTNEIPYGQSAQLDVSVDDVCGYVYCESSGLSTSVVKIKHELEQTWTIVPVNSGTAVNFSAQIPATLSKGYYSLLIELVDNAGNKLSYEVSPAFLIGERENTEPYARITLIEPINNSINAGVNPTFVWSAVDNSTYALQIADDSGFTSNLIEATTSTPTYQHPNAFIKDNAYYWRVRPVQNDVPGRWSNVFKFNASTLPVAELLTPAEGSNVTAGEIDFSWTAPLNAFYYRIELSKASDFSIIEHVSYSPSTSAKISLYNNETYYWRVVSQFFHMNQSLESVSEVSYFTVTNNGVTLPVAQLLTPALDAVVQSGEIDFSWTAPLNASYYRIELSKTNNFSSIDYTSYSSTTTVKINLSGNQKYYWRVISQFLQMNQTLESVSDVSHFTLTNGTVTLLTPADNSEQQVSAVTFSWVGSKNAISYTLELSFASDFSKLEQIAHSVTPNTTLFNLTLSKKYFWRVTAYTPTSPGNYHTTLSPTWSFTTVPDKVPLLVHPLNHSLNVPLEVEFSWTKVNDTDQYILLLSKNPTFTTEVESFFTTENKLTHKGLAPFHVYYWRVISQPTTPQEFSRTSATFQFATEALTSVEGEHIQGAYAKPNPFSADIAIVITSGDHSSAEVTITDQLGRTMKSEALDLQPGENTLHWNGAGERGQSLSSGIYFAIIRRKGAPTVVLRLSKI